MAAKVMVVILVLCTFTLVLAFEEEESARDKDIEEIPGTKKDGESDTKIGHSDEVGVDQQAANRMEDGYSSIKAADKTAGAFVVNSGDAVPKSYVNGITATTNTVFNASSLAGNLTMNAGSQNKTNEVNTTEAAEKPAGPKWDCGEGNHSKEFPVGLVDIVDDKELQDWLNATINGSRCVLVLFYARFCRFSAQLAPLYNALGRSYDKLPTLAIDAYQHNSLNARFGIIAVPTVLLFYSGKPVLKFNNSITLGEFQGAIKNNTGLESNPNVTLSDKDFEGPLSSTPTDEVDIYLILSSLFLLVFGCYMFVKSRYGRYVWETIDQIPWHRILHCFRREKRD